MVFKFSSFICQERKTCSSKKFNLYFEWFQSLMASLDKEEEKWSMDGCTNELTGWQRLFLSSSSQPKICFRLKIIGWVIWLYIICFLYWYYIIILHMNNNTINRDHVRFSVNSFVSCYSCVPWLVPCFSVLPLRYNIDKYTWQGIIDTNYHL